MADNSSVRPTFVAAIVTLLFTAALVLLMVHQMQPPAPVPASAPLTEFSSGRAMEHVRSIARAPHPTGSAQNAQVREYIVRKLQALGLEIQVQSGTVVRGNPRRSVYMAATVHNIVGRMPGSANRRSVLLVTHHDSVPTGPGASDDGSGIATLLETARALRAGEPLRNDILFLFTDAEELGLLGAKAFVDEHPWARDVGVVINFEARGSCGPVAMFETSSGNADLIREFAQAAPRPISSSFLYDFYKRMPNDTDLTVFKNAGYAGLNFSYAGCWPRYHTMGDSVENLDERSLQHDGLYASALARHFGAVELNGAPTQDAVFASVFGTLLHYPAGWVIPLMIVVVLLFAGVLVLGLKTGGLRWCGIAFGFFGLLAGIALSAAICELAWYGLSRTPLASMLPYGMAYNSGYYAGAFMALTVAIVAGIFAALRDRETPESLTMGAMFLWLAGAVATGLYAPGGSYLFAWPLLAGLLALACILWISHGWGAGPLALAWIVPSLFAVFLFGAVPYVLLSFLSTSGLIPMIIATGLLVGFLAPQILVMASPHRFAFPASAAVLTFFLVMLAMARSGYSAKHPQATGVFYSLNSEKAEAYFVTTDRALNAWTRQFMTGALESRDLNEFAPLKAPALATKAPVARLDAPRVTLVDEASAGEMRIVTLRIQPARQARALWISTRDCRIIGSMVNGKEVGTSGGADSRRWDLYYSGPPEDGVVLSLVLHKEDRPVLTVADQSDGMPDFDGRPLPARPGIFMPSPTLVFDSATMVSRTMAIPAPAAR